MEQKNLKGDAHYQIITIKTIDGSTIQGKVNISLKNRVSEIFTETSNPFIVMTDVITKESQNKTFIINKSHIVWVEPEEKLE